MIKKHILAIILFIIATSMCACRSDNENISETLSENAINSEKETLSEEIETEYERMDQIEKGYDLPVDDSERNEATEDCKRIMNFISDIYEQADKGEASNVVLSDETVLEIQNKVAELGCPVRSTIQYSGMENYETFEDFLKQCMEGNSGSVIIYDIHLGGGVGRSKYIFDGTDMYVLNANSVWNQHNQPTVPYISYTRLKDWKYTAKGWFCYELCVPEPPAVTEIVDGSRLIRVQPLTDEQIYFTKKYVAGLGYQGNNLLCSNWDSEHLSDLDYNGIYEYLYRIKYQTRFDPEIYSNGIPKKEFESLIMEYLPVTADQLERYAVFDEENQTYAWARLGCSNYAPTYFGTSIPEVTGIKENEDGTITLTVDAVCEMILCDDAIITHELTIRTGENGKFQYLGNMIMNDGISHIPEYQYRFKKW